MTKETVTAKIADLQKRKAEADGILAQRRQEVANLTIYTERLVGAIEGLTEILREEEAPAEGAPTEAEEAEV